ncbi:MAG: rhodanese-like domain-containing protein [Rectinemataceae bacterium]
MLQVADPSFDEKTREVRRGSVVISLTAKEGAILEPLGRQELLERVKSGEALILDVRPVEEFASGHIFGDLSIPLPELERRLATLPVGKTIVAYCRGPYCVLSAEAVARLRDKSYRALRLEVGYPEWRDSGFPIEAPTSVISS